LDDDPLPTSGETGTPSITKTSSSSTIGVFIFSSGDTAIWNSRCFCAGNCERICRHLVISLEIRRRRASMPPVWSLCLLPYLAIPSAIGDYYISFFFLFSFPGSGI
jgi:hypothetical protein